MWAVSHAHLSAAKFACVRSPCACSVSQGATLGSALSPSITSSFTQRLGFSSRTQSELSSPRSSDASLTRKNKLWPFSKVCSLRCSYCMIKDMATAFMCVKHDTCSCTTSYAHCTCNHHNKLLQKVLEGDPGMTLIQLDVKEGNVNDIVNESVRSTYQVRH